MTDLISYRPAGIYVEPADVYIDAHKAVDTTVIITHGHSDHARRGHRHYITTPDTATIIGLRYRIHDVETHAFHETFEVNGVRFTLIPAGHILGSAQVLIEHEGQRAVVTGDYNCYASPGVQPYEVIPCDHLVMECTFGLPIFHWGDLEDEMDKLRSWWRTNQRLGRSSVLLVYSLGKAQRMLGLLEDDHEQIAVHPNVGRMNQAYNTSDERLPEVLNVEQATDDAWMKEALILTSKSSLKDTWASRLSHPSIASASGWNATHRRRQSGLDAYITISDHADWPGLLTTAFESKASRVDLMHGFTEPLSEHLLGHGIDARAVQGL